LANRIWIDVEDLSKYLKLGQRRSGIKRLEFELCRAFYVLPQSKGRMFFVSHDLTQQELVAGPWETVETASTLMTSRSSAEASRAARVRSALEGVTRVLSPGLRKTVVLQIEVLASLSRSMRARAARVARL
jgi:hypothetical protein